MNNLQKLAYSYNSLMTKTAKLSPSEELAAMQLEEMRAPSFLANRLGDARTFMSDSANRNMLINRGAIGALGGTVAGGIGALGASEARNRLRDAGFSAADMDNVLTGGGGAARTIGSAALGGAGGAGIGYGLGAGINYLGGDIEGLEGTLAALGGAGGAALGTASGYEGELSRADEAIAQREYDKLVRTAKSSGGKSKKRRRR
jgi:hypothetical protein